MSFTGLLPSSVCLPRQFYYQLTMRYAVLNPKGITTSGLASSHFARRYFGNLFWFLFLRLLRCFSSAGFPAYTYWFSIGWQGIALPGFPIRISADLCLFAAPRSFSQLVTSFFGSWCQGILHVLFFAWPVVGPNSFCSVFAKAKTSLCRCASSFPQNLDLRLRFAGALLASLV